MKKIVLTLFFVMVNVKSYAQITTSKVKVEQTNNVTSISGRVGIGTSAPGYSLDIKGNTNDQDLLRLSHPTSPTDAGLIIGFGLNKDQLSNGAMKFKVEYSSTNFDVLEINRVSRDFSYLGDGNVGIGTNAPSYKLDIKGNTNDQDLLRLSHPTSPTSAGLIIGFGLNKDQTSNAAMKVKVEYSSTNFDVLEINRVNRDFNYLGDGNVGIGTNTPNYKLDVNGSLNAQSLYNSGQQQWSDFVFSSDYELPKLSHVEQYVKKNGHLRGIPTETEVLKNGYNIGDMDAKLLQKIEELTLYLIEQNKQNQAQQARIEKLEKELQALKDK